jgi:hypothetical protein
VTAGYRIADEPRPGALAGAIVDPFWPLLAAMLAGSWLALPWFALNGVALGSPTLRRELAWIAAGLAVSTAAALGLLALGGGLPRPALRAIFVVLVAWRLGVAYVLHELQSGPVELHRTYGGAVRNGMMVALAGMLLGPSLTRGLAEGWGMLFQLVLG